MVLLSSFLNCSISRICIVVRSLIFHIVVDVYSALHSGFYSDVKITFVIFNNFKGRINCFCPFLSRIMIESIFLENRNFFRFLKTIFTLFNGITPKILRSLTLALHSLICTYTLLLKTYLNFLFLLSIQFSNSSSLCSQTLLLFPR
jgi:hypothetical protein